MLPHSGKRGTDGDAVRGAEPHEIDDAEVAVRSCDVGIEAQAGTKERRAMFARDQDDGADQKSSGEQQDARAQAAGPKVGGGGPS